MATDSRRSTAAQFFMEEEEQGTDNVTTTERVVELLNKAALEHKDNEKVKMLRMVQELIVHKESSLLDNFLDEMLAFQSDKSADVKRFIISFMEEACKKDPEILTKVMGNLNMLLLDENVQVMKKVILVMSAIYKLALKWICKAKKVTEIMEQTWHYIVQIKNSISELIDSENDGIRTHALKFVEAVVIALSERTSASDVPKSSQGDISLDQIPSNHALIKRKKMEEEGKNAFEALLTFQASPHISSVNLMTCLGSMTSIAKQRPQFIQKVVLSMEALHVNLPPTLSKSQVSSVRKNLKMQMLHILKHPESYDFHLPITTLLTDLGATQNEVMRAMPKVDESRKRKNQSQNGPSQSSSKKQKLLPEAAAPTKDIPLKDDKDDDDDDYLMTLPGSSSASSSSKKPRSSEDQKKSAIDVTAEDLIPRLSFQNVADLVLLSMVMLPESMPAQFQSTYTPIAAAGTQAQIKHLARLLATQLTASGLGKGVTEVQKTKPEQQDEAEVDEDEPPAKKQTIQTVVGGSTSPPRDEARKLPLPVLPPPTMPPPTASSRKGIRAFKLSAVTRKMEAGQMDSMALEAVRRILHSEKAAETGNMAPARCKILTGLVAQFGGTLKDELKDFIFEDLRNRTELAIAWIYQEYANYQGYNVTSATYEKPSMTGYDDCLTCLLNGMLERPDQREGLFSQLILEAPSITPNAIQILRKYCQDETRIYLGMTTLKELIVKRPCMKLEFLDVLLDFTSHEKSEVRNNAIRVTKKLHERSDLEGPIEKYALYYLKFLLQPRPPSELFGASKGKPEHADVWTEETIKLCLYLYLSLLPVSHALIQELANVYTGAVADTKRTILRVLENPVKGMGMQSPELLKLVENCPRGAETLVTRVIHILTDKAAPSPELVERVRELYHKRVSDVRFLIPVLNGLTRKEVIQALPKLIKLNPVVVKEVFNRLLGTHVSEENYTSPLTPAELLIALHNIDANKVDMKTIIKATNLCFGEKSIYTQEVLAMVMQQLMEVSPLPTLFMRTVIQSLAMYPKVIGLVLNIMQRLIIKSVWKQKKVWEGFVKCCQRTKPQSYQVLLQLPPPQLKNAFEIAPDLREPLLNHVLAFTPHQRAHIPKAIMVVLEKDPVEEAKAAEKARKQEEARMVAQEKLYQEKLEEERKRQQEKETRNKQKQEELMIHVDAPAVVELPMADDPSPKRMTRSQLAKQKAEQAAREEIMDSIEPK